LTALSLSSSFVRNLIWVAVISISKNFKLLFAGKKIAFNYFVVESAFQD